MEIIVLRLLAIVAIIIGALRFRRLQDEYVCRNATRETKTLTEEEEKVFLEMIEENQRKAKKKAPLNFLLNSLLLLVGILFILFF